MSHWRKIAPLAIAAGLIGARQLSGAPSVVLLLASTVGLYVYVPALLVARVRRGDTTSRRARLALAGASTFLLLLTVLVVTIVLRGDYHRSHSQPDPHLARDARLGWAPAPSARKIERGLDRVFTVGQRFDVVDPQRRHVVVVGDSWLWGWLLEDDETAVAQLARRVTSHQVLNASTSGWGLAQYYLYLEQILPRLKADVVVVGVSTSNDYIAASLDNWFGRRMPIFVPEGDDVRLAIERIPDFSCIEFLMASRFFNVLWRHLASDDWVSKERAEVVLNAVCDAVTLSEPELYEVVRRTLRKIERLVHSHGARLVYLYLPMSEDVDGPKDWHPNVMPLYRLLSEGSYDVIWLQDDLLAAARASEKPYPEAIGELYLPGDIGHFSQKGNQSLADVLQRELKARHGVE